VVVGAWREASPANVVPCVTPCDGAGFVVRFSFIDARGVGHMRTARSVSVTPCLPSGVPVPERFMSIVVLVGQSGNEPEPLASMRGTNIGR
jgi:hypothetical protein